MAVAAEISPGPGRPRSAGKFEWPIFDTMAQASAVSNIPLQVLKEAKSAGCPAFHHGRVYFGEFLEWIFTTNSLEDKAINWGNELQKVKTLRERIKLSQDEKRVVDRDTVADGISTAQGILFGELDRIFVSELPSRGKALGELKLRNLAATEIERLKTQLKNSFDKLANGDA